MRKTPYTVDNTTDKRILKGIEVERKRVENEVLPKVRIKSGLLGAVLTIGITAIGMIAKALIDKK